MNNTPLFLQIAKAVLPKISKFAPERQMYSGRTLNQRVMRESLPMVSVVIPTYNRGASILDTIESIFQNSYPDFEIIVVDQSKELVTKEALERYFSNRQFKYIHTDIQGAGRARNMGIAQAEGSIVAITDDDCVVPTNWISAITEIFQEYPKVAVVLTNVVPGEHDAAKGFIPSYIRKDNKLVKTIWEKRSARGIGASLAIRKDAITSIGGYDNNLGPGAHFPDGDDIDLVTRAVLKGWWAYETHEIAVTHYGFRTWAEGKHLTKRNWIGIGATYAKPLKCGYWQILGLIFYEAFYIGLLPPLWNLLRLKKPNGLKQIYYFFIGFFRALATPVDREKVVFNLDPHPIQEESRFVSKVEN